MATPRSLLDCIGPWVLLLAAGCDSGHVPALSRQSNELWLGQSVPNEREEDAIGTLTLRVSRGRRNYRELIRNDNPALVFKDEERTGADRMMTPRLARHLNRLAQLVGQEWLGLRVRVTDAWDEEREHRRVSAHYEGRAADLTTSDVDSRKLGRLGYLAVEAGFDWVYYENRRHIHVSVRR
jgi:hypothetical protein